MTRTLPMAFSLSILASLAALVGCSGSGSETIPVPPEPINVRPTFLAGPVARTTYDGTSNDLLTGGLGRTGLQAAAPPAFANANNPTPAELRVRAIYNNYRALIDPTPAGGFGVLYGPNVNAAGVATTGEGRIAGDEYIAFADDGSGRLNVTMMVQVPSTFDTARPCIVTGTSSGSRGVYGAIGTAGEWGLKNGCAVAYSDKGSGNGGHDLQANLVSQIDGTLVSPATAGLRSVFSANITEAQRTAFNTATPSRWAFKHAHSQQNPERDWGTNTLQAVQFAFFVLNERFAGLDGNGNRQVILRPANTIVIASSASNGAGAALAAAEQDTEGWIDGVAVSEPQIQIAPNPALTIRRGTAAVASNSLSLFDFNTLANLYQPCAALSSQVAAAPALAFLNAPRATARCAALRANGLLTSTTLAAQADEALARMRAGGVEPESELLQASHYVFAVPAIALTYANAYSRASVTDNLCGFSFAATDAAGLPTGLATASEVQLFASGNGIPATGGVNIVNNASVGGPLLDGNSTSASTGQQDLNFDGAFCLRNLLSTANTTASAVATRAGIGQVLRTANLRGKPTIIVHGRSDALVPVNHTSRPYLGNNRIAEGAASRLFYYEVTNAQHFDTFIGNAALAGYDTRYVPLHPYLVRALDLMLANLRTGAAIPASQVVRTTPRGGVAGAAPAITAANVPPIAATPAAADAITFSANVLTIPN